MFFSVILIVVNEYFESVKISTKSAFFKSAVLVRCTKGLQHFKKGKNEC